MLIPAADQTAAMIHRESIANPNKTLAEKQSQ